MVGVRAAERVSAACLARRSTPADDRSGGAPPSGLDLSFAAVDPQTNVSGRVGGARLRCHAVWAVGGWNLCGRLRGSGQPCLLAMCFGRELVQGCTVQGSAAEVAEGNTKSAGGV